MRNRAKTRARMQGLLERWKRSGESAAAFSRRHGIYAQKLGYWKRVIEAEARGGHGPVAAAGSFVPVRVVGEAMTASAVEIVLGAECRLIVREGVSRELLRDVLAAVREGC